MNSIIANLPTTKHPFPLQLPNNDVPSLWDIFLR